MKTTIFTVLTSILACTNATYAQTFNYKDPQNTYTWTGKDNKTHTSHITDIANDPRQMWHLRNWVMGTTTIPGNININDENDGCDIPYKNNSIPSKDGFTCFLHTLKQDVTNMEITHEPFDSTDLEKTTQSIILLDNVTECASAYILSFSGNYDRFYFAAKGKGRMFYGRTEDDNWELMSATGNDESVTDGTDDFYQKLQDGETYKISHDCFNVAGLRHYYSVNDGGTPPYMTNVTLMVPKNRMKYWGQDTHNGFIWPNSGGKTRDTNGMYTWYNPTYCPRLALYKATLSGSIAKATNYNASTEEGRQFTVTLNWSSNLKNPESLNWPGSETYDIYIVNEDGTENLLYTKINSPSYEYTDNYSYNVPQQKQGYQINYKVVCRPSESDPNNPVGPAITNTVTVNVPGYNDNFLWQYSYRSKFNVATHKNSYKNTFKLTPLSTSIEEGKYFLYRKKKTDNTSVKIAEIFLGVQGSTDYSITYNNDECLSSQPLSNERYDAIECKTFGHNYMSGLEINDYFTASTADGGDLADSYIYFIEFGSELTTSIDGQDYNNIEGVKIPVYNSLFRVKYDAEYSSTYLDEDEQHNLNLSKEAKADMNGHDEERAKYRAVTSWDIYHGDEIKTFGSKTTNSIGLSSTARKFTGQMTVNSFYGPNTYGTNEVIMQGANIEVKGEGGWTPYGTTGDLFAYSAEITLIPHTAAKTTPFVYYYRIWRQESSSQDDILLNKLSENTGKGWGTNYDEIKGLYPIGNSNTEPITIRDIYVAPAFEEDSQKDVTYTVRMYATSTPEDSKGSLCTKDKIIIAPVQDDTTFVISEAKVDINYTNKNRIVTSVDEILTNKRIVDVTYYNLCGIGASTPFTGVNIKVEKFADGTTNTSKLMK